MKVLVDADACPVKNIISRVCIKYNIELLLFTDTNHMLDDENCKVIIVEQGSNSVDLALINKTNPGDIIVTQDYGLATLALAKKAYAIGNSGLIYTEGNIDSLLFKRHLNAKIRRSGGKSINPSKRTKDDDNHFEKNFIHLCEITKKS